MVKILLPGSKKRPTPSESLEGQQHKKRKLDNVIKMECGRILRTLMTHKFGAIFNEPVDPVQLGIPDYFLVISHPMDLGTISKKLEDNIYSSPEAFVDDIRLTFSNAMRYNPPKNFVHTVAKELNDLFSRHWRSFEVNMKKQSKKVAEPKIQVRKNPVDTSKICNKTPAKTSEVKTVRKPAPVVSLKAKKIEDTNKITTCSAEKPSLSGEEKLRLKKDLMVAVGGELSGPLRGFLRKYGLSYSRQEKIESAFSTFGDDTLWELRRVLKGSLGANMEKAKDNNSKSHPMKETTERQKLEEKSNIESRIRAARAAKEALLESAKSDLQMRRDKERERVEKMSRTVIMDDNQMFVKELEKLCLWSGFKNTLEKIGLRLKDEYHYGNEYIDDDNNAVMFDELEDGEIF